MTIAQVLQQEKQIIEEQEAKLSLG